MGGRAANPLTHLSMPWLDDLRSVTPSLQFWAPMSFFGYVSVWRAECTTRGVAVAEPEEGDMR